MCLHIHAVMSIPGHMTRTCWSQKEQRTALCMSCFGFFNDDCRTEIKLRCKSSLRDLRTFCLLGKRKRELSTIVFFKMCVLYLMNFTQTIGITDSGLSINANGVFESEIL